MTTLTLDPRVAQRNAADPASSVWVGASAGTGKTKVLTDRVLRLMLTGTPPGRILCLTFTKAAAAEMANRLNTTLSVWATLPEAALEDALAELTGQRPTIEERREARRLFARVLECPGGMKIQTIHAFCQALLGRFPLEAGLQPNFTVLDERSAAELLEQATHHVLNRARHAKESGTPDLLSRAIDVLATGSSPDGFSDLIRSLSAERNRIRRILDHHGGAEATAAAVYRHLGVASSDTKTSILKAACREDAANFPSLREACHALSQGASTDQERALRIQAWIDTAEQREAQIEDYVGQFLTQKGTPLARMATKGAIAVFPSVVEVLTVEANRLLDVLAKLKTVEAAEGTAALLHVADALLHAYAKLKAVRGVLDFDDLILAASELLTRPGVAPWVLFKLDGGLDHILVDEAQDTNPEQWQVVAALAEEFFSGNSAREVPRTLFVVGDEKQSIFSFQRADAAEFIRMRRHFQQHITQAEQPWSLIDLEISFRSTAAVLSAVDKVFALPEARDGVIGEGMTIRHIPFRRGHAGVVEVWPTVTPLDTNDPEPWSPPLAREAADAPSARLAAIIAETVRRWLQDGEMLDSKGRPIRPGDIMVLVRRRGQFFEQMVRALKERGVPVAGVDRMVLTRQLAVMDLIALGEFLLLPEDDLTLATVLKGPLIGLDDDQLFRLAHGRSGRLWRALEEQADTAPEFRAAHAWLASLLSRTDFIAPFELFASVLSAPCPADTGSGRKALLKRLGPEAQDALDEFLSACLAFEREHPPALQAFLHWLCADETEIKRELDNGTEGEGRVRIMTVHGSKGLQAPIVFLPDTVGTPDQSPAILWPDGNRTVPLYAPRRGQDCVASAAARSEVDRRRDQEYRRLLYVALTRAEDHLYVCGWETKRGRRDNCWYDLISQALADFGEAVEFDFTSLGPEGWTGKGRRFRDVQTVEPKQNNKVLSGKNIGTLPPWALAPAPDEPVPSRPLAPSRPDEPDPPVRSPVEADDTARFKRGTLIHRLLQTLPDLPLDERPESGRRFLALPAHGLTPTAQAAILAETLDVLNHPEFAPLFGPSSQAEVPLVALVKNRALAGQIDRLLVTDDTVWIIDYKTNRPPPTEPDQVARAYLSQMAAYRAALQKIYPGKRVRGVLLWTDVPRLMELPDNLLDAHAP